MKSLLFGVAVFMTLILSALAQNVSSTVSSTQSISLTIPALIGVDISSSNVLLPIVIDKTDGEKMLEARLVNLQSLGVQLGMERMILEGEAAASDAADGGKDYTISWGIASLRTQEGEKLSTYIGKPLQSNISANPVVKGGDSFTAEGDPVELIAAWKRLQEKLDEEDKDSKEQSEKNTDVLSPTKDFATNPDSSEQQAQTQSPQFQVKADPITISTRDGCNMNVDFAQMVAIVQERTLQDGKEVAACQDTLTRYPLDKTYSTCPVKVDNEAGKVYQQYTLSYNDPVSGGAVQVADCQPDNDRSIPITLDTASCGLRHDFDKGVSYQRAKKTYVDPQGNIQTLQDCEDTDETYAQETTYSGCDDIVDIPGMNVVHQKRIRIMKDGQFQYITECAPDTADNTSLQVEACVAPNRYTHDFGGGQSFLNQTIYYADTSGNRKDVQICQPGVITFSHKKDETVCPAINNDSARQTTLYAKTYIEEVAGQPIYLNDCQAISPAISYVKTGDIWKVKSTTRKDFEPTAKDLTSMIGYSGLIESVTYTGVANCGPAIVNTDYYTWQNSAAMFNAYKGLPFSINTYYTAYRVGPGIGKPSCNASSAAATYSGNIMCVAGPDASNWTTMDGIKIDPVNSTSSPTTVTTATLSNMTETISNGRVWFQQSGSTPRSVAFTCTRASCDVTTLLAHPRYIRGDNTVYNDLETVTDTKYVCGDGSNLEGKAM
ncbi:MAG: hypothetical protein DI628_00570 [Blastochloris viridis]|uniref:Uncharacterized protein n=1 Tax=Blastochloris viridis TaxID=1079 RepID=A0A6N4RBQ0_BLAVI|nr:MAG: hypothetical protein DI628_00570 [Blastochloris viridis]